jgi:membrane associated rhomboid family serine protease
MSLAREPMPYNSQAGTNLPNREGGNMFGFFRILALCALGGFLLATVFMTPGGAAAGAVKGLLVGTLIAWGEWKSKRKGTIVSYVRH